MYGIHWIGLSDRRQIDPGSTLETWAASRRMTTGTQCRAAKCQGTFPYTFSVPVGSRRWQARPVTTEAGGLFPRVLSDGWLRTRLRIDTGERTIMKFRFMGLLLALLASSLLSTTMVIAQDSAPAGPASVPSATDSVKAEAAPVALAGQGLIYAGGHKGGWLIFAPTSRGTFQDYTNPPRYYANSMTYAGILGGSYWVFNLDGFAGPPQFGFAINSSTGSYPIIYRPAPNVNWVTFDTTGRGTAIGNQK